MSKTPSIAVIPSGYKGGVSGVDGTVYSVLPTNGDADLDFTRNCVATRVNQDGLLEEVGLNVPRLDYSDGGCPSLLLEPQRTNIIEYSEDFSNASWIKTDLTIGSNSVISPDGSQNADKIIDNANNSRHRVVNNISSALSSDYTLTCYLKKGELNYGGVYMGTDGDTNRYGFIVDLTSGEIVDVDISGTPILISSNVYSMSNGWYKLSLTLTNTSGLVGIQIFTSNSATPTWVGGVPSYVGNSTGIYIWGAQLEEGSYATSYIPTNGATVTRFKEEASKDNLDSYINSSEGVLYAEISALSDGGVFRAISLSDGTAFGVSTNAIELQYSSTTDTLLIKVFVNGLIEINKTYTLNSLNYNKIAFKWSNSQCLLFVNGSLIDTLINVSIPSNALTDLTFSLGNKISNSFEGKLKDLRVFNEALTDAELITLTTI